VAITARVVGISFVPTLIAPVEVAAQGGGAAQLDPVHGVELSSRQAVRLSVRIPVLTKYISQLGRSVRGSGACLPMAGS
jgi:hypothetical protein